MTSIEARVSASGTTHVGMRRNENQDNFLVAPELNLFVVADGMGGHKGGETASALAIKSINEYFLNIAPPQTQLPPAKKLTEAIESANNAIQAHGRAEPSLAGMGTTATALYFANGRLYLGQVGDSRAYLIHPQRIWQITRDHSLVQEKLRAGLITRAQLKTDRMKNVITRSVGFEVDVEVDLYNMQTHSGDVFVLCSDGLTGMVEDQQILSIVEDCVFGKNDVQAAAQKLIDAANRNGGDDNVTAIVIRVD